MQPRWPFSVSVTKLAPGACRAGGRPAHWGGALLGGGQERGAGQVQQGLLGGGGERGGHTGLLRGGA
jgi:hypothetical protein